LVAVAQTLAQLRGRYSARWHVVSTVTLILLPALLLAGWLAVWSARSERAQLEQGAMNQARESLAVIDRDITGIQNALEVLAGSPHLQSGDMKAFYDQAMAASRTIGLLIVLRDLRLGQQVINTKLPWGTPPAAKPPPEIQQAEAELSRTGKPVVSGVFFGPRLKQHFVTVLVPVFRGGDMSYSLAVGVPLTRFAEILGSLDFHPGQIAIVIDRSNRVVARSQRHDDFAGIQFRIPLPPGKQSVQRLINRDGTPFHWFNRRSDLTGWIISVGLPDRVLEAPSTRAFASFAIVGTLLLAFAIALSYRLGGRLSRSMGALGIDRKPTREEFEVLFESAPNGVMVVGHDGVIVLVNERLEREFGYRKGELAGQTVESLVPKRIRDKHLGFRQMFALDPQARPMGVGRELFGLRKDGSEFPVEVALNPITTAAGDLVMAAVVDISARKLSEKRLSAALIERDDFRRRFMQAQEQERLRLAQELHDQTGQSLTAAMLELKGIEALVLQDGRDRVARLRDQMEEIGKTLHRVAWELRPASIDEVGLASALDNYISEWSAQYKVEADFFCADRKIDELPDEIRTAIYRIVQEGLTNIAKHAQRPSGVSVVVERRDAGLHLMIEDDGCGFEPEPADGTSGGGKAGLGIAGMRERLSLLGGELEIESSPGRGTTIFAKIPLRPEELAA
jgi:PAS domain S-box-containing protein